MTQFDFGTLETSDTLPQILSDLNSYRDAVNSTNKGGTEPSYKVAGMLWVDDAAAPTLSLKLYDGTDFIAIGTFDTTLNTFSVAGGGGGGDTIPTGSVSQYIGTSAPTDWLLLDGSTFGSAAS